MSGVEEEHQPSYQNSRSQEQVSVSGSQAHDQRGDETQPSLDKNKNSFGKPYTTSSTANNIAVYETAGSVDSSENLDVRDTTATPAGQEQDDKTYVNDRDDPSIYASTYDVQATPPPVKPRPSDRAKHLANLQKSIYPVCIIALTITFVCALSLAAALSVLYLDLDKKYVQLDKEYEDLAVQVKDLTQTVAQCVNAFERGGEICNISLVKSNARYTRLII